MFWFFIHFLHGSNSIAERTGTNNESISDSVFCSKVVPTSMVFVPCRDGISHNPTEYCSSEDCMIGAQVLMGALLRYDMLRAQRSGT